MNIEVFMNVIGLPLWAIIAIALAGVIVGMFLLMTAIMLLGRGKSKVTEPIEVKPHPVAIDVPNFGPEPTVAANPVSIRAKTYKPVPPIRQHYWYYVPGVAGRFALFRDALSAAGVKVPADKMLDWKKLTVDKRNRIKRVKIDADQPAMRKVMEPVVPSKAVAQKHTKAETTVKEESGDVIKKSIGDGCFVTFRKKGP